MMEREWRWRKLKDNSYVNLNIPVINEYLKANSYTITRLARAMGVHESLIKTCFEKKRMGTALYKRMCNQLGAPCSKLTTDPEDSMYKAPIKIYTPQKIDKNEYAAEPVEPKNYVGSRSIDFNGQSLYNYLKNNKIAQTWVSEKLGKDKTCVNKYILHNKMPYESYVEICKILNVSEDKFLGNFPAVFNTLSISSIRSKTVFNLLPASNFKYMCDGFPVASVWIIFFVPS